VVIKQEEGKLSAPSRLSVSAPGSSLAVKTEPEPSSERSQVLPTDATSISSDCPKRKDALPPSPPQLHHNEGAQNPHEIEVSAKEDIAEGDGEIGDQQSVCSNPTKVLPNAKDFVDNDADTQIKTNSVTKIDLPNRFVASIWIYLSFKKVDL
jgi:hypothetical protein